MDCISLDFLINLHNYIMESSYILTLIFKLQKDLFEIFIFLFLHYKN